MATADHDSNFDLGGTRPADRASRHGNGDDEIWLAGDVLACACPDCGTPMSIRHWLMVADCWRCGASIELDEEQEREALRLLHEREESRRSETRRAATAITPTMLPKTPRLAGPPAATGPDAGSRPPPRTTSPPPPSSIPKPSKRPPPLPGQPPPPPGRRTAALALMPHGTRARLRERSEQGAIAVLWGNLSKDLPAWAVSLVLHAAAMLLLGLWVSEIQEETPAITLATSISEEDLPGEFGEPEELLPDAFEFEDPGLFDMNQLAELEAAGQAEVELEGPSVSIAAPVGEVPDFVDLLASAPPTLSGRMFGGRDPRLRAQIVEREGGTNFTEAAVARGLVWLARHQNADGSWSLDAFDKAHVRCQCGSLASQSSDTAGTALGLLPFLGAGHTHLDGDYRELVGKGLSWLVGNQQDNGDLRDGKGFGRMYAHGQAAIVLCEAYAMTGDPALKGPAKDALYFIVKAQHSGGGWRYTPGQAGDTSVVGWQLMALHSGRASYLAVPQETLNAAGRFLDSVQTDSMGGQYGYTPGSKATSTMSAEALLCRLYLGWPIDHRGIKAGAEYLLKDLPDQRNPNLYYWYYATQMMHHVGGDAWKRWNSRVREALVAMQETQGPAAGSWTPRGGHASRAGRVYMTSLAVCTLEVYYRHMPLNRPLELAEGPYQPELPEALPDVEALERSKPPAEPEIVKPQPAPKAEEATQAKKPQDSGEIQIKGIELLEEILKD